MLWASIKQPKSIQILQTRGLGIDGDPIHDITFLASERDITSDATFPRPSNLPTP